MIVAFTIYDLTYLYLVLLRWHTLMMDTGPLVLVCHLVGPRITCKQHGGRWTTFMFIPISFI